MDNTQHYEEGRPMDSSEPTLGMTAEAFYNEQRGNREGVVTIGRRLADMTIPSVFPPVEYDTSHDNLAIPNQSINAFLVSGLSNVLSLTALPPDLPMAKFQVIESKVPEMADPEVAAEADYAMSRLEEKHRKRLAATMARAAYTTAMTSLIIPGNVLTVWKNIDTPRNYNLHQWVCKRDAEGWPLVVVLEETISMAVADEDIVKAVKRHRMEKGGPALENRQPWQDEATIYHVQKWCKEENEWLYWQEAEGGYVIPGTDFWSPKDVPCMYPGTLTLESGSNYGLGYAHMFEGDLASAEDLSAAFKDGAAALSWFLTFVNPMGQTDIRQVRKASNLSVLPGRAEDVTAFTSGKSGDMAFIDGAIETLARRLGQAFANKASIQRTGERVTREEWLIMTQALQEAMGGLYSLIAFTYQRWFVRRFVHLHRLEDKSLKVPEDIVQWDIVTGMDSIGRSSEYENTMGLMKDLSEIFTPQGVAAKANFDGVARRLAAGRAVKIEGLLKSNAELQAEQQQVQQQDMLSKAAGPIATGGMDMLKEYAAGQMAQSQEGAPVNG